MQTGLIDLNPRRPCREAYMRKVKRHIRDSNYDFDYKVRTKLYEVTYSPNIWSADLRVGGKDAKGNVFRFNVRDIDNRKKRFLLYDHRPTSLWIKGGFTEASTAYYFLGSRHVDVYFDNKPICQERLHE